MSLHRALFEIVATFRVFPNKGILEASRAAPYFALRKLCRMEICMVKRAVSRRPAPRRFLGRREESFGSQSHTEAYLATREALRRIARSSRVACLTLGAVTISWSTS